MKGHKPAGNYIPGLENGTLLEMYTIRVYRIHSEGEREFWKTTVQASKRNDTGMLAEVANESAAGHSVDECLDSLGVNFNEGLFS